MSFSYGYGSNFPIDSVRLLVADTVEANHIWEDSEITLASTICQAIFLAPSGGGQLQVAGQSSPRYTAATLLRSLASNRARLGGALKVLDISVDLGQAAKALQAQADALEASEDNMGNFAFIESVSNQFDARNRLWSQMVRLQG